VERLFPVSIPLPAKPRACHRLLLRPGGQHAPTKFANIGSAKGLALELADRQDNILIAPQASFNAVINQNDHTATFPLAARYYATSMPVSAGTFSSVVQVTFTYQ
jgi:minor fimbrial subunit